MGSYSECWLNDFSIGSEKNGFDSSLMSLFRAHDKRIVLYPSEDLPEILQHYREAQLDDPELPIVYYESAAYLIKDRLNVMGYTLKTTEQAFLKWFNGEKKSLLDKIKEYKKKNTDELKEKYRIDMGDAYSKEYEIIADLTPSRWLMAIKQVRELRLTQNYFSYYEGEHKNTLIGYLLSNNWYGFPGYDTFVPLRLLLEDAKPNDKLIYDVTSLIWAEYFSANDDFVNYDYQLSVEEYSSKAKIIILTEGRTDSWVLKESLALLYPHLTEFYSFLDFDNSKFGGGVGNLTNLVKAFTGAGVVNNIIALFDNDTAALSAIKGLEKLNLPENIKILQLPELDLLKNYPTLGPSGEVLLNINGIAASIELYFGEDVLKIDGTNFTPIQWTGYDTTLRKYQGEVLEKKLLQERFKNKLSLAKLMDVPSYDSTWKHVKAIFKMIFNAFETKQKTSILQMAKEYYK